MADITPPDTNEPEEGKDAPDTSDADLLKEARDRYKLCSEAWSDNRKWWLEDAKFREPGKGNQWPADTKAEREADGRPCVEVDKLNQYVRQVVNDGRQNRPGVKVRPEGNGANADVAEAWEDFIRGICARSNADEAFDTALDHAAGNGYGFFRVITDYVYPGTFHQELKVVRIPNPRAVMLDPYIQKADGSDARFGFVECDIPKDEYKRQYPKAKYTNWDGDGSRYGEGWISNDCVRVVEYFYKVEEQELVHLLEDDSTITDEDYQAQVAAGTPPQFAIVDSRDLPTTEVRWCRLSGAEILEKKDWVGKQYIPLVLIIGNESNIDGKITYSGLIRPAKDPQRLYNYSRSAYIETVALAPKAPLVAAAGQVENHPEWQDANKKNYSVLTYDPIDINGTPLPPPQRIQPPTPATGWLQDMDISGRDIQGAMGMYNASLGERSNEKSGKAIMARQREGDTGTFHYPDNLNRGIRLLGRIMVDSAPRVYDSKRVIHLLGEDGTPSTATIDPQQKQPVQELAGQKIFNPFIGIYGVDISSGPSYTTKRQEAVEAQMQLVQSAPETMQFAGDLIVKNMDWPGADALAERYRLMLPPQIQQALQGQTQLPPEVQQAVDAVQQQQEELQQAHQQLQDMANQVAQDKAATDAERAKLDAARAELTAAQKLLQSKFEELSAKLELKAMQLAQPVPAQMPAGDEEPAIAPGGSGAPPQPPLPVAAPTDEPPPGGFFTPNGQ